MAEPSFLIVSDFHVFRAIQPVVSPCVSFFRDRLSEFSGIICVDRATHNRRSGSGPRAEAPLNEPSEE